MQGSTHNRTKSGEQVTVVDAQMAVVADIDETIVATPTVGVDGAFKRDTPLDNGLQRSFFTVRYDLGIDPTMPLEDAKYRLLECASTPL